MATDDGLGAPPAGEENLGEGEENIDAEGMFIPEPREPEPKPEPDEYEWLNGADDDAVKYVKGKGYKSAADVAKSAREAERALREAQNEAAQLRTQTQQDQALLAKLLNEQESQSKGGGDGRSEDEQLLQQLFQAGQAYDTGEVGMDRFLPMMLEFNARQQRQLLETVRDEIQSFQGEHVAPLQDRFAHEDISRAVEAMAKEYPDDRIRQRAAELIQDPNEGLENSGRGVRQAFRLAAGEFYARAEREQTRSNRTETITSGGRGNANQSVDAGKMILQMIESVGPRVDDGI